MIRRRHQHRQVDPVLMFVVFGLVVFGLVMIGSAGSVLSYEYHGSPNYYLTHQLLYGFVIGLIGWFLVQRVDYHLWKKFALLALLITLVLLGAVFLPQFGVAYKGAARWIQIGGLSLQPTEIVKLTFLLYLAAWLEKKSRDISDVKGGVIPFLILLGAISVLVIFQPDVGTLSIIILSSLVVFFVAGAKWRHLLGIVGMGVIAFIGVVKAAPYRWDRITVFMNPNIEPQGIGYQIRQALIAIGSGGVFGLGLGHSHQKYLYLPEVIGDSIFAIISEELGFIVASLVVLAYFVIAVRGYQIAIRAPDTFGRLLATGITTWIVFQALTNIAAITGLIPLTGIPLPFISYGSSALIVSLIAVGILLNISSFTYQEKGAKRA